MSKQADLMEAEAASITNSLKHFESQESSELIKGSKTDLNKTYNNNVDDAIYLSSIETNHKSPRPNSTEEVNKG